jgi:adenylate cyclase
MQWPASLDYGTERYPVRVARRLKVLNATTWCGVLLALGFTLSDFLDRRLWPLAAINVIVASLLAAAPLLHRFHELAGALFYGVVSYTAVLVICSMLGTDCGMQVQYLAIAAGAVLVLGPERIGLIAFFVIVGVGLIIALELTAPADTGLLSPSFMFGNFLACITGTSAILAGDRLLCGQRDEPGRGTGRTRVPTLRSAPRKHPAKRHCRAPESNIRDHRRWI